MPSRIQPTALPGLRAATSTPTTANRNVDSTNADPATAPLIPQSVSELLSPAGRLTIMPATYSAQISANTAQASRRDGKLTPQASQKRVPASLRALRPRLAAGLAQRDAAERLEDHAVTGHRGDAGRIERRRDLGGVHRAEVDRRDDRPHRPQELPGHQPARLRRAGAGG